MSNTINTLGERTQEIKTAVANATASTNSESIQKDRFDFSKRQSGRVNPNVRGQVKIILCQLFLKESGKLTEVPHEEKLKIYAGHVSARLPRRIENLSARYLKIAENPQLFSVRDQSVSLGQVLEEFPDSENPETLFLQYCRRMVSKEIGRALFYVEKDIRFDGQQYIAEDVSFQHELTLAQVSGYLRKDGLANLEAMDPIVINATQFGIPPEMASQAIKDVVNTSKIVVAGDHKGVSVYINTVLVMRYNLYKTNIEIGIISNDIYDGIF